MDCCCYMIWLMIVGACYWQYTEIKKFEESSTKEICNIVDYVPVPCIYKCGSKEIKDRDGKPTGEYEDVYCDSIYYEYTAVAKSKCGDQKLKQGVITNVVWQLSPDKQCNDPLKDTTKEYDCWVLECDKGQYSFNGPEFLYGVLIVVGVISFIGVCVLQLYCDAMAKQHEQKKMKRH